MMMKASERKAKESISMLWKLNAREKIFTKIVKVESGGGGRNKTCDVLP